MAPNRGTRLNSIHVSRVSSFSAEIDVNDVEFVAQEVRVNASPHFLI